MGAGFAILRTKRITDINKAFNHNLRVSDEFSKHTDKSKREQNLVLYDRFSFSGGCDFEARIDEHIKEKNIFVKKGTNVKCLEFVLTASPEFFKNASESKIKEWRKTQMEFLKKEFGSSVLNVVEHNDETTKHIQCIILADKKKLHKYKNQKGEFFKEKHCISPGDFDPQFLRGLQDRYAESNKKFGLVRGLRNSKATHRTLKEFYSAVDKAMSKDYSNAVSKKISKILQEESNYFGYVKTERVTELLTPIINDVFKSLKAVKTKLNFNTPEIVNELNDLLKDKENIKELRKDYMESIKKYDDVKKENEELKKKLDELAPKKKQVNQDNQEQIKIDNRYKI